MPPTILVTGATGFIGGHLVARLAESGSTVRCLVRPRSDRRWLDGLPLELIPGDLDDLAALRQAVDGVETVYHLAGVTKGRTEADYHHGNATGTGHLLEAIRSTNPTIGRVVVVSSLAACGPSAADGTMRIESDPMQPITAYGRSKAEAERIASSFGDHLPVVIVRPPAVYGPRDREVLTFFQAVSRGIRPVVGWGEAKRVSLIHAHDLVRGIHLAGTAPAAVGGTYFLTSERGYTWPEIGEQTARAMGRWTVPVRLPEAAVHLVGAVTEAVGRLTGRAVMLNRDKARDMVQPAWVCSPEQAARDLGFRAEIALSDGLAETISWYRTHGWL